jgi:hypothetical protein
MEFLLIKRYFRIIVALPSFPVLVIRLILLMERYIQLAQGELPRETIPQALKNMVQVLDNSRIFDTQPLLGAEVRRLLGSFLPELVKEIFAPPPAPKSPPCVIPSPIPVSISQFQAPVVQFPQQIPSPSQFPYTPIPQHQPFVGQDPMPSTPPS